ncbi:MAG: PorV/PorQ family protein [Alistipes sp.]|nr:PorV/PorQ family protein [Alistipes sp.]
MKKILTLISVLLSFSVSAQGLYDHTPDARIAAMGGASVATRADAFAAFGNAAASLMEYKLVQVAGSYTNFTGDIYNQYRMWAGGAYARFAQRHAIAIGLQFNAEPRNDYNDKRPGVQRFDLAYGYKLSERVSLAATARYRRTYNYFFDDDNYNGGGADLTVYSRLPMKFLEGSTLNIGGKLSFDAPIAPRYNCTGVTPAVGVSLSMPFSDAHLLDISTEIKYGISSREDIFAAKLGAEYTLMRLFYLRAGGNVSKIFYADTASTIAYGSVGAGVRFFHLQFDVAYLVGKKNTPFHNAVQINFGLDF